jgi:hypothetical protein
VTEENIVIEPNIYSTNLHETITVAEDVLATRVKWVVGFMSFKKPAP